MGHSPIGHHSPQPHYHQQHSHLNNHYQQQYHQQQWLNQERLQHDREREAQQQQGFGFFVPGYAPPWNALFFASPRNTAAPATPPKPVSPEERELRDRASEWSSRHEVGHPIDSWY
ncbi:hypothetical protein [Nocardia sp. NPDC020380]|uniref:hypothetical protein n=1 Tax=Nocardia sp. NPDC020380 TaxID=3364309 RepID=UPI00379A2EA5